MTKPWEKNWDAPSETEGAKPWEMNFQAAPRPERTALDVVRDVGVTGLKGAVALPAAFVGLADIPTGGRVGKFLEDNLGYRPGEAQEILEGYFSEAQKAANAEVDRAEGFVDTVKAAIQNPSTIAVAAGESLPLMLGGAAAARGLMALAPKVAPWVAAGLGEGLMGAGSAASEMRQQNEDRLLTLKQSGAALASGAGTAVLGMAGGRLAQKMGVPDVDTMLATGKLSKSPAGFVKAVAGSGISEGLFEELPQSAQEQMWQNWATGRPVMEGVGKASAMGMLSGAAMGGAGGGFNAAASMFTEREKAEPPVAPDVPPAQPPAQPPAAAAPAQQPGVATADVEQAERALRQPVQLTALDRAQELQAERSEIEQRLADLTPENGYGPTFDAERAELNERGQRVLAEIEQITRDWPATIKGAPTSFSTEAGVKIEGQYAIVDADSLVTSHDEYLRANPMFPAEMQPRDRSRSASELQISSIVQRLDPSRLGVSADAATGAPIMGADGLVESGNARSIALKRVYQANGQKAEDYRAWLRQSAEQFGLDPQAVDGVKKPVLVRVRQTPVNRAEFARQANQSTIQRMSTSEQAKADAARLTSLDGLEADEQGDFSGSRDFIRQFMSTLPITEQSDMIESDGRLSTTGYRRIQNAVLAKAYGDSPTLRRMTESLDNNLTNVSKALVRVAPTIAAARERIASGNLNDADIAPELIQAVEGLSEIKDRGWSVEQELGQSSLEGPKYSPEAADLLRFLSENARSPRRIAEFFQRYYEALEAAGDPNQGTLLDAAPAPTRADLIKTARGQSDGQQNTPEPATAAAQDPGQRGDPQRDPGRPGQEQRTAQQRTAQQRTAEEPAGEWVAFPRDTGTIGIPRAQMPQIKSDHRGALLQFLKARGIESRRQEIPATDLKPTQAEFSTKKAARWTDVRDGVDRSVLASSDGYILDGHHQWVAALAAQDSVQAIVLDAPIRELLAQVFQFPSVTTSDGALELTVNSRQARQEFREAMADLADILADKMGARVAMVDPNTPGVHETLVRLFAAAIKVVGTDLKRATKWVKDQLKGDADTRKWWNKISDAQYQRAALEALEAQAQAHVDDLFARAEPAEDKAKERFKANFKAPALAIVVGEKIAATTEKLVAKWRDNLPKGNYDPADIARAEAMLGPVIEAAKQDEGFFDAGIMKVAAQFGGNFMLGPTKKIGRAAQKLVEENFDLSEMKDIVRATIVVESYSDAQMVVDAIGREFKIHQINNKAPDDVTIAPIEGVRIKPKRMSEGYKDVTAFVKLPGGGTAEIQINTPEMLSAKDAGHVLYEASRVVVNDPERQAEYADLRDAQIDLYRAAGESNDSKYRAKLTKFSSVSDPISEPTGNRSRATSDPSSDSLNTRPSGNSTQSPSLRSTWNRQPGGNLSGTFTSGSPIDSIPENAVNGYNESKPNGGRDANVPPGNRNAQAQGAVPAQGADGAGDAASVRPRAGGRDQQLDRDGDAGRAQPRQVGSDGLPGQGGADASVGRGQPRARARRVGGVPASRDIAVKTGRNYAFGQDDLTYEGSWIKKAEQNIEAIELIQALQKEGRQATREEQAVLAKFIGWGASDLANNLFGKKLDKAAEAMREYDGAIAEMKKLGRDWLDKTGHMGKYADPGFYSAVGVLRAAGKLTGYQFPQRITRAELDAARPEASTRKWLALRDRLKELLTAKEYAEASKSTQYAHFTSKAIVSSMWRATQRMGFAGGTILEPGAGIGVFPGLMPAEIANNSSYTGIEFEPMTGAILQQLFPDERNLVESFVDSKLPKNFYDVAIGNPPFSPTPILSDPEYKKQAFALHDYFFAKTIDRVKPGGLVMFVTSRFTMDKLNDKARKYLAERADLVGAIRLPQTAFKVNAGTEVVTDVLFLRKKVPGQTFEHAQPWLGVVPINGPDGKPLMVSGNKEGDPDVPAMVNEYFAAHPEMVLGTHSDEGKMRRAKEYTVKPLDGDIEAHFAKAIESLPEGIYRAERGSAAEAAKVREIDFNPKAKKEGNYYVTDAGAVMIREGGVGVRVTNKSEKDMAIIRDYVPLRDALKQAHYDQLNSGDWESSLAALQKAYKAFTDKHGHINRFTLKASKTKEVDPETGETFVDDTMTRVFPMVNMLRDDPDSTLVAALEDVNDDTGEITPARVLRERVLLNPTQAKINSPVDALMTVLNDLGYVDMAEIAHRVGMSEAEAIESLGTAIYEDPEGGWEMADAYLSGNVKAKLQAARAAAQADRRYERNVTALEAVQPAPKTPSQIDPRMGMNWIPEDVYEQFAREVMGLNIGVLWNDKTRAWSVEYENQKTHHLVNRWGSVIGSYKSEAAAQKAAETKNAGRDEPMYFVKPIQTAENLAAHQEWGTGQMSASSIMEHALSGSPIRVFATDEKSKSRKLDPAATEAAKLKMEQMLDRFSGWVFSEPGRTDRLVKIYNDTFNTSVPRKFDGSHLTLPGASAHWQRQVHPHVKRGVWRIIQTGNTYLAHAVGSGKTAQMVMALMEQKRLGLINKPMVVVPNHMLKQFASEWLDIYPAARLMVADEANFHTENRRRFVSRVALSDLDGVVITHSAFKLLDLDPAFKAQMIEEQLDYLRASLDEAGGDSTAAPWDKKKGGERPSPKVKQIERQIESLEEKLKAALSSEGKDKNARFDELGVDFLAVDEAHEFRKLDFATTREVKGLSPQGSQQALDLYMKVRYLDSKKPGRNLVMASGTAVTNTVAELYTVQRFMDRKAMEERGIEDFDSWAAMFGRERSELEPDASGRYSMVTRFSKFVNVPELTQMFRQFADVLTSDHLAALLGDKRPKVEGGSRQIIVTPKTDAYALYQKELERRIEASRAWRPSKDEPNNPDPVIAIIGDGRLAAIDMRFIDPKLPSDPDSKLNRMITDLVAKFKETAAAEYKDKAGNVEPAKGSTMMVFSDLGFGEGVAKRRGFNARAWFEKRLRDEGIPMSQVAFMQDHKKSAAKLKLFKDVNAGRVRILVGSSKSMGTGVNAQQRLKAMFHLDSPWYPADLEQREGRIIRQGNKNPLVQIYAYASKGTYDETMWKLLASKQFFIDQAMSGDANLREIEDLDGQSQYDLAAAMVAEDPRVLQLAGMRADIEKMQRLFKAHEDDRARFRMQYESAASTVDFNEKNLPRAEAAAKKAVDLSGDKFNARSGGKTFTERLAWGNALMARFDALTASVNQQKQTIGEISGFEVEYAPSMAGGKFSASMVLQTPSPAVLHDSSQADPPRIGLVMRAQNAVADVANLPAKMRQRINDARAQMDALRERMSASFPMAGMLADKIKEVQALTAEIAATGKEAGDQTETPEFKAWFGDSKAVDTNGKPLVVYTGVQFAENGIERFGGVEGYAGQKAVSGAWLTSDPQEADFYAMGVKSDVEGDVVGNPTVYPVYVSIKAPAYADNVREAIERVNDTIDDATEHLSGMFEEDLYDSRVIDELKAAGFDGVVLEPEDREYGSQTSRWYFPFANTQIKSAIGNNGQFDPENQDIRMSRRARDGSTDRVDIKALRQLADRIQKGMPNLPKVHVLTDPSAAPKALLDHIRAQGALGDVEGALHNGELYLFASGLADLTRAEHVLAEHEAAHYGLRAILGDGLAATMRSIHAKNGQIRKAAAAIQKRTGVALDVAVEEAIVDMPSADLARLKGWRQVVGKVRDWLAKRGYENLARRLTGWIEGGLTEQQRADLFVADLVRAARDYVAGKSPAVPAMAADTRLSGTLAQDIERQEKWLNAEARARGYKDVEDLLAKNYPLFEKLAAMWRQKNPAETLLSRDPDAYAKAVRIWQEAMDRAPQGNNPLAEPGTFIDMPMPTVYTAIGFKEPRLKLPTRYMQGIRADHPDVPASVLRDLPQMLSDPVVAIPHTEGGYRVMIDAQTAKGEPIVVGIKDGQVQTITPMHDKPNESGADKFAFMLNKELGKEGVKVYARSKEALAKTRAPRGVAMGTLNPNHSSSTTAVPAISALHRSPRDKAIVVTRDKVVKTRGEFGPGIRLSRATPEKTAAERADAILAKPVRQVRPLERLSLAATKAIALDRVTGAIYDRAGALLERLTPERIKAGVVSDFGVPEAVLDQRVMLQGRQRVQLRKAGSLLEKLATLTREESRVAYEWMNMDGSDPKAYLSMMQGLPEESVKVLTDVQKMIDDLSKEAVRLGQLDEETYKRHRFAYLRRSYAKHIIEQTPTEQARRARTISILGDQYKGRGLAQKASMDKMKAAAPEWWGRKLKAGKADTGLKGEKFVRLEYRVHKQSGVAVRELKDGKKKPYYVTRSVMPDTNTRQIPGLEIAPADTMVKQVVYWPAGEKIPPQYADWNKADTWEVRDTKGGDVVLWRDFTKEEREQMGEIDEARFAIAKTLHGMIQDVETGRYLAWLARTQAKAEGQEIPGTVVDASEHLRHTFTPGEWVKVPDTKIPGTSVFKYGALAGKYLPGPVWNDLRQVVAGRPKPLGETYAKVMSMWKTSKTALSPAVHMNNVMANFVMADWQDVTAAHVAKSLRIILAAAGRKGGIADAEAATEILNRYKDSGAELGSWVTQEIAHDQLDPLLENLVVELAKSEGVAVDAQVGVYSAVQHLLHARFPQAWEAFRAGRIGKAGASLIDLYQAEDDLFRLAAWIKAKEEGIGDLEAGKIARRSFLDYSINAPWIQAMRATAWPFISFTYRAVPLMLEMAARKPHKLIKLMGFAAAVNAFGYLLAGGDEDDDRKMLPEEKAGAVWGLVPKLIRMPWNDEHGSPVFLDIRRWIPVGDVFDMGQGNAAIPMLPSMMPGGPLVIMGEVVLNRSAFTGKEITLGTDTGVEKAQKLVDHLYKAFAPNILGLPGTYATTGVVGSLTGRTDAFGRELSTPQAVASSFGVKLGSYPQDVLRRNLGAKAMAEMAEIDRQLSQLKRQYSTGRITREDLEKEAARQNEKKRKLMEDLREKIW